MISNLAPRRGATLALAALMVVLLAACSDGSGADGDAGGGTATVSGGNVDIFADDLAFDVDTIEAPAGEAFTITLNNLELMAHNVSVYTEQGGDAIVVGDFANNEGDTVETEVPALEPGEYYFLCDVHPDMDGTLVVEG